MFTFSDTFVPAADYVAKIEHETFISMLDETEHDYTPDPADYTPDPADYAPDEDDFIAYLDEHAPAHDDDSNYMIVNHYRGI